MVCSSYIGLKWSFLTPAAKEKIFLKLRRVFVDDAIVRIQH